MHRNESSSEQSNALRIAVIDEQISGLREQQRTYNTVAQRRFDTMETKIDELTAIMNRGRGAYAASIALAAAFGAVLVKAITLMTSLFQPK